jgi:V/A-type H+/Na+-transporting ATPase subunit D
MGVRHPDGADYAAPPPDESAVDTGTAVVLAREAYLVAAATGAEVAAAVRATRAVAAEADRTRRRLRALDRRAVPRLRAALDRLELDLEEREQAEHTARRGAAPP